MLTIKLYHEDPRTHGFWVRNEQIEDTSGWSHGIQHTNIPPLIDGFALEEVRRGDYRIWKDRENNV